MPRFEDPSVHGDLYVEYIVVLPTTIGSDQRRSKLSTYLPCVGLTIGHDRIGGCFPKSGQVGQG
jgi:hypothetical protein